VITFTVVFKGAPHDLTYSTAGLWPRCFSRVRSCATRGCDRHATASPLRPASRCARSHPGNPDARAVPRRYRLQRCGGRSGCSRRGRCPAAVLIAPAGERHQRRICNRSAVVEHRVNQDLPGQCRPACRRAGTARPARRRTRRSRAARTTATGSARRPARRPRSPGE
jgi:hypothetical protein